MACSQLGRPGTTGRVGRPGIRGSSRLPSTKSSCLFPRSSRAAAKAIIDAGLGRAPQALYERCEQQAQAFPLSPAQQSLLRHDVGADKEPSSHDVLTSMGVARGRELARAVVLVLRMTLDQQEWGVCRD